MKSISRFFIGVVMIGALLVPQASSAVTVEDLQAQINALLATIAGLQTQLAQLGDTTSPSGIGSTSPAYCGLINNLKFGDTGTEVMVLQRMLIKAGYSLEINGIFGEETAAAVSKFQLNYKSEVLSPLGLNAPTGYVGKLTRAKLNKLYGCVTVVASPIEPPPMTSAGAPGLSFSTNFTNIYTGNVSYSEPPRLTWQSTNATSCTASGGWSGTKALSGWENIAVTPPTATTTITYTLTCTGASGSVGRSVKVVVLPSKNDAVVPPPVSPIYAVKQCDGSILYTHNSTPPTCTATTTDATPVITTAYLPNATVGIDYRNSNASITSSGGTGTRDWYITSGKLPPGIDLNTVACIALAGVTCSQPATIGLFGIPTAQGEYTFTITLTVGSQSTSKQFTSRVMPRPEPPIRAVKQCDGSVLYTHNPTPPTCTATTTHAVTLSSISPTSGPVGTNVVLTGCGSDSSSGFTLIYAGPKSGTVVIPVETLSGENSCGYMTFAVPLDFPAGTYTLLVKNNSTGQTSTNATSFIVTTTPPITSAVPNISYINPTTTSVGDTVYVYGSNLYGNPFSLDGVFGLYGVNYPDTSGNSFSFVVPSSMSAGIHTLHIEQKATGAPGNSVTFTIVVLPATTTPSITILSPNGGEVWQIGQNKTISWAMENIPSTAVLYLSLVGGPTPIDLKTVNPIGSARDINLVLPEWGCLDDACYPSLLPGFNYKIRATVYDKPRLGFNVSILPGTSYQEAKIIAQDSSDAPFSVFAKTVAVTLSSISPTSGPVGTNVVLTGCGSDSSSGFTLIYAGPKSGTVVIPVETLSGENSCGYMTFAVPLDFPAGTYTLLVKNNSTGQTSTNATSFIVTTAPSITVLSPNGGETWARGTSQTVTWSSNNIPPSHLIINIELVNSIGAKYSVIDNTPNDGQESVLIPSFIPQGTYWLEIMTALNGQAIIDGSDRAITVIGATTSATSLQTVNQMASALEAGRQVLLELLKLLSR